MTQPKAWERDAKWSKKNEEKRQRNTVIKMKEQGRS